MLGLCWSLGLSACQAPGVDDHHEDSPSLRGDGPCVASQASGSEPDDEQAPLFARPDRERDPGIVLREPGDQGWWLRARLPFALGLTDFDLDDGLSIDKLTTVSLVPTVEMPWVVSERWTVVPYIGLGAAYQTGSVALVGDNEWLGLAQVGVRGSRWQTFGERWAWLAKGELSYDAALDGRDGVLGDWGSVDVAFELRGNLGSPGKQVQLQPGVYVQGMHFWQSLEVNIDGVSPEFIENQLEVGISFGTNVSYKIAGISVPRIYVGFRDGEELRGLRIRFGQL